MLGEIIASERERVGGEIERAGRVTYLVRGASLGREKFNE